MKNDSIDLDFEPEVRIDGFDEYRLHEFLLNRKNKYPELLTEEDLQEQFEELVELGIIYNPKWHPSTHLYYLTEIGKQLRSK